MPVPEFREILMNDSESLKPIAVNLTRDKEMAKDLFQETMYRALANEHKYSNGTNLKAWLFTIMRNIFINDYRRNVKHRLIFNSPAGGVEINTGNVVVANDGEQALHVKEIKNTIHQLPQIFQTPFLLYFEGYRYHEISESLNEPLGTIKSRIYFARKLLKEKISRN